VSGSEVEDAALSSLPAATGAEFLSAFETRVKDNRVGVGNVERFAVHLGFGNDEVGYSPRYGVLGVKNLEALRLAVLSPGAQPTTGSHKSLKWLRLVC